MKSPPCYASPAWKMYPLQVEPTHIIHFRKYPSPQGDLCGWLIVNSRLCETVRLQDGFGEKIETVSSLKFDWNFTRCVAFERWFNAAVCKPYFFAHWCCRRFSKIGSIFILIYSKTPRVRTHFVRTCQPKFWQLDPF